MTTTFNDIKIAKRRFAIYPCVKDITEDTTLQQIQLREDYCIGILYPYDNVCVQGKYYYYVNPSGIECLICEMIVRLDMCHDLTKERKREIFDRLISEGLSVEKSRQIIMEGIRTPYRAKDYIQKSACASMSWINSLNKAS